VLQDANYTVTG